MFKDIALSKDLVDGYRDSLTKGKGKAYDDEEGDVPKFTVMVLQQSVWPFSAKQQNVDLPKQVRPIQVFIYPMFLSLHAVAEPSGWVHKLLQE